VDPDAVWDGEWGRSNDGCITWVLIVEGEGTVLGVNLGHPTVTNGDCAGYGLDYARATRSSQITLRTCFTK